MTTPRAGCAAALAALSVAGCTKPLLRLYPGGPRPPGEVAILRHQTGFMKPSIFFDRIDGSSLGPRRRAGDLELLPGRHVVEFAYNRATWWSIEYSIQNARVVMDAEAGHEYEARACELPTPTVGRVLLGGTAPWGGCIVDRRSGAVVGGAGPPEPAASVMPNAWSVMPDAWSAH